MTAGLGEQERVEAAIASFRQTALADGPWLEALSALAQATGANHGQIIGIGPHGTVPFNWVSDAPPALLEEFVAAGGGDPRVNPRIRAGLTAPELTVLTDDDFMTPELLEATPIYADLFRRCDVPFIALTRLTTQQDVMIRLSTLRSAKQGPAGTREKALFSAIAPHVRSAVTMRLALEERGAELIGGTLEAVSAAAFVLDFGGRVAAMTPAAEALVSGPAPRLRLAGGRLAGRNPQEDAAVAGFVARAVSVESRTDAPPPVVLRGQGFPLVLESMAAPPFRHGFGFAPCAIAVVRSGEGRAGALSTVRAAFGLTPAEVDVVAALCDGKSPDEIAIERGVSIDTIRSQIRGLLVKTGARRQPELVALIARYL